MALLKFLKGNYSSLNTKAIAEGQILICGDTGEMFVDVAADKRVKIGDFIVIDTLANLEALDASSVPTSRLYYVEDGNILARSNGTGWTQINKQPTAAQIKEMIGLASYETKVDAEAKLTAAKGYTDTEVAKVQGEVDALETYVGTFTHATAKSVVEYVDAKTAGIATDAALAELQGKVTEAEKAIDALEAANEADGAIGKAIADAQAAAEAAQATADKKTTMAEVEAKNYATKEEAQGYADAKDEAIAAAKKAGDDAQADVDALAGKVGEVGEGATIVGMIGDVETLAGNAQKAADAKVASVTAGDASVTVAGTTAVTVAAKISADAGNALELAEDGLKVIIPAAAEYSIVKAADSGDYAAVYNLTKDGAIVGASINIPKDLVVKSGSVVNGNIVLVLNDEANTEITIPASSLIEYVTSGSATGDMVVINVSDDHKVTATITDGTVGIEKLTADVQTKINKAHSHANETVLNGITAEKVAAWDEAEANAIKVATDNNTAMDARVKVVEGKAHEHGNKELLDTYTQTEANLADAVAKKHAHANADELAKIADGDVEKWNSAQANAEATAAGALAAAKSELEGKITAEANRADAAEKANAKAITDGDAATLQSAKDYADEKVKALEEGTVADNAAGIADILAQLEWGTF